MLRMAYVPETRPTIIQGTGLRTTAIQDWYAEKIHPKSSKMRKRWF